MMRASQKLGNLRGNRKEEHRSRARLTGSLRYLTPVPAVFVSLYFDFDYMRYGRARVKCRN